MDRITDMSENINFHCIMCVVSAKWSRESVKVVQLNSQSLQAANWIIVTSSLINIYF